jgi:hypothetical protein
MKLRILNEFDAPQKTSGKHTLKYPSPPSHTVLQEYVKSQIKEIVTPAEVNWIQRLARRAVNELGLITEPIVNTTVFADNAADTIAELWKLVLLDEEQNTKRQLPTPPSPITPP